MTWRNYLIALILAIQSLQSESFHYKIRDALGEIHPGNVRQGDACKPYGREQCVAATMNVYAQMVPFAVQGRNNIFKLKVRESGRLVDLPFVLRAIPLKHSLRINHQVDEVVIENAFTEMQLKSKHVKSLSIVDYYLCNLEAMMEVLCVDCDPALHRQGSAAALLRMHSSSNDRDGQNSCQSRSSSYLTHQIVIEGNVYDRDQRLDIVLSNKVQDALENVQSVDSVAAYVQRIMKFTIRYMYDARNALRYYHNDLVPSKLLVVNQQVQRGSGLRNSQLPRVKSTLESVMEYENEMSAEQDYQVTDNPSDNGEEQSYEILKIFGNQNATFQSQPGYMLFHYGPPLFWEMYRREALEEYNFRYFIAGMIAMLSCNGGASPFDFEIYYADKDYMPEVNSALYNCFAADASKWEKYNFLERYQHSDPMGALKLQNFLQDVFPGKLRVKSLFQGMQDQWEKFSLESFLGIKNEEHKDLGDEQVEDYDAMWTPVLHYGLMSFAITPYHIANQLNHFRMQLQSEQYRKSAIESTRYRVAPKYHDLFILEHRSLLCSYDLKSFKKGPLREYLDSLKGHRRDELTMRAWKCELQRMSTPFYGQQDSKVYSYEQLLKSFYLKS
ncbi:hypothetical protein MIR68_010437 [Amoeboaphelidium protococcarum]|nr:hypothetical protein MIR68_010437 [Amoeboaphelidium protococcarum]